MQQSKLALVFGVGSIVYHLLVFGGTTKAWLFRATGTDPIIKIEYYLSTDTKLFGGTIELGVLQKFSFDFL